ncbi:hypothetical protein EJ05DRAFT_511313 [Pseudovirgaria hyperparasitica]|uniref:Uncharacterized protein n=1 Tax=Pseudovirgaria hyperparasitica TaxID=470096 RepID=A0A6A6W661_9PEZI|nr:uncharacterized protein EJ05DRAFT_511313 [Pseudovirgaria hyperparasitica]KAF2757514.1 hypothetical protein EJ05DRAFT_511313 [Pseudovirgaria hyperparasitica]
MAEVYDTTRFGQLYYASRQPRSNHLFLAAYHLAEICQNAGIQYAFLGGWTVQLRGGSRETQDVDISVKTTMELFKKTLLKMPRICFPQIHGQTAVNLFVHTGKSYDQGYDDLPDLAVQVDVIISGNLNSPTDINSSTSETIILPNGFNARVINIFFLLRGKFNAFVTRGHTSTNDYEDLVFLITRYPMVIPQYSSYIDKEYRLKFLEKFTASNAGNEGLLRLMKQRLGLVEGNNKGTNEGKEKAEEEEVEEEEKKKEEENLNWIWDATHGQYRRLIEGKWQWAPVQQKSSQPEAYSTDWAWDDTHGLFKRFVGGEWQWAPVQQQSSQPEASSIGWAWDDTHGLFKRFVGGEWQWASSLH